MAQIAPSFLIVSLWKPIKTSALNDTVDDIEHGAHQHNIDRHLALTSHE